jgi:hypothetical protein
MTETRLVCSKCGKTKERSEALKAGWLEHQIKDAPAGYLIIRCPEHITGHALRMAGLPQQKVSKRIADNLDRGLWCEFGDDYIASASEIDTDDGIAFALSYHHEGMPAHKSKTFDTVLALIVAMREVEPDLRKWRLREL